MAYPGLEDEAEADVEAPEAAKRIPGPTWDDVGRQDAPQGWRSGIEAQGASGNERGAVVGQPSLAMATPPKSPEMPAREESQIPRPKPPLTEGDVAAPTAASPTGAALASTRSPSAAFSTAAPSEPPAIARIKAGEVFGQPPKAWRASPELPNAEADDSDVSRARRGTQPGVLSWGSMGEPREQAKPVPNAAAPAASWDGMGTNTIVVSEADRKASELESAERARAAAEERDQPQVIIQEGDRVVRGFEKGPLDPVAPPAPEAPLDAMDKLEDVWYNPLQLVPYLGSGKELWDISQVGLAAYRLSEADKNGSEADAADLKLVRDYVAQQNRDSTFGYRVANTIAAIPAFAGELASSGGTYTAGQKVALKAGKLALEKFGSKAGAELLERLAARAVAKAAGKEVADVLGKTAKEKALELAARSAAATTGAVLQTVPASGLRVAGETIQRMMPEFEFSEDERGKLSATVTKEGDDFGPAMTKAFGSQFTEVLSERTGGALAFVPGAEKLRLMKTALMKRWFGTHPQATPEMFTKLVNAGGWSNVVGEMFEERVGDTMKAGMGLQSWSDVIPTPEQLLVEAVSFGITGAAGKAVKVGHAALREAGGRLTARNTKAVLANPSGPVGAGSAPTASAQASPASAAESAGPTVNAADAEHLLPSASGPSAESSANKLLAEAPSSTQPSVVEPGLAGAVWWKRVVSAGSLRRCKMQRRPSWRRESRNWRRCRRMPRRSSATC